MKFAELCRNLKELARALEAVGATKDATALSNLAAALQPFGKRDVAALKSLLPEGESGADGQTLRAPLQALNAFSAFIERAARPSLRTAFNDLKMVMNDRQDMTIRSFVDALHSAFTPDRPLPANDEQSVVDAYVDALGRAKHDDKKFPLLFEALSADERIGKDELVAIASRFAFRMAKSTSRKVALERIWKMHNASETFAAKSRATKGKSAA